jgi:S-DNA-T family DNA segregation ATPase FtsK/SpoIIIE
VDLGLGVVVPASGARADVLVRAPQGTPLAEVARELLARVLPAGSGGRLSVAGAAVPPTAVLGVPPLLEGAVLEVDAGTPAPSLPGLLELRCTGGPDAGGRWPLVPGEVVVGRGERASVRVADPDLSRAHLRLQVPPAADGVTVADLGSTNGTSVDGAPIGEVPAPFPLGAVLRAGESTFEVRPPAEPPSPGTPTGAGQLAWNRPPRLRPPYTVVQVVVPAPPGERETSPFPVLMVLAPLVLGVVLWRVLGNATFLLFTLLSPLMVIGNVVTERRSGKRRSRKERALWQAQRSVAETTLREAVREDQRRRRHDWPDPAATVLAAEGPRPRLWERRRTDGDVLDLRLGLADQPARVEAEGDVPAGATTARNVPVVVALREAGVLGLAGPRARAQALARWAVLQAAVWHSPRDLQVVVLAEPAAAAQWEWVRWLPHVRPDGDQDCRALVGLGPAQAAARVAELSALVERRRGERAGARRGEAPDERLVLVVVDGARALRTVPGLAALLGDGPAVGIHAIAVEQDARLLPEECGATAVVHGDVGTRLDVAVRGREPLTDARVDLVGPELAERVARSLAPLRDDSRDRGGAALPPSVRWTEVVDLPLAGGAGDAAQVLSRWSARGRTTSAVLGRGPDGAFAVDVRRDGPHALVAGTTGSGKSELLQTLLGSLALGNRPDEMTFVLVDFKGGAAFGPCARLPHVVGLVTDLDGALVERALASLGAELARREGLLAAVGAKDLEDHRRLVGTPGGPAEPLPRLMIVVDEFASLAAELPDFVQGLVGIAMRGRSLGVHLVLATQRPEGVVSADIRANTNLRICLAVTRDSESRDVLDSPAAASISRTTPGRGYARTGHTELTMFQAGRVGGRRPGVVAADLSPSVVLLPVDELGDPLPRAAGERSDEQVTDLSLLVDACAAAAERLGLPPQRSPWLPPLPEVLVVDAVPAAVDPHAGTPGRVPPLVYGVLDVPAEQSRRPLALDLDRSTHLMVVGQPRTGRTTVLRTLAGAVATTSPDDVHLYVLDPGGGALGALAALPHTGAVVARDQPERLDRVLAWLAAEVGRRQALLGDGGHSSLAEQRAAAAPAHRLPHLLLLLDRWEAFLATYGELDAGRLVDVVFRLLREGPSAGLHVVVTADRSGLVGRVGSLVDERLLLRLADKGDYAGVGVPTRTVPLDMPAGRGFWLRGAPLLAQVALLHGDPSGPAQTEALRRRAAAVAPPQLVRPRRVEVLPTQVRLRDLPTPSSGVVLGVGGDELQPVVVDVADHPPGLLVGGPPRSGRSCALLTVAAGLRAQGLRLVALAPRPSPLREVPGCLTSRDDAPALEQLLGDGRCALLVDDAELLVDSALAHVLEKAVREARDAGTVVVAAGTTEELVTGFRGFVVDLRRSRCGVLLSPQGAGDGDLLGVRLSRGTGGPVVPGRGLLAVRGAVSPVQLALPQA